MFGKVSMVPTTRLAAKLVASIIISSVASSVAFAQQTGGGATGGGGAGGGTAQQPQGAGGSDFRGADEAFADGVQRTGAPEERAIGTGGAEVAASQGGAGGAGGFGGGLGGFGGLGGLSQLFGGAFGQTQQQSKTVRLRLSSAIRFAPLAPTQVGATVTNRVSTTRLEAPYTQATGATPTFARQQQRLNNVSIQMDGRTAILNGRVSTDADRRMAVLLTRLEPGVSKVEDRLRVEPQ
jgi:hypothetical protein